MSEPAVPLRTIARAWGRIGCTGFGGPPAHIALLRRLCVVERRWIPNSEFEDGIAACNLLPGPASTQLAILCAWRLRGWKGGLVGGICFIVPGLVLILALAGLFLGDPPLWVRGAAAGAGSGVAAVAAHAALGLVPASWTRASAQRTPREVRWARVRWTAYALAGAAAGAAATAYLVLVLLACGLVEVATRFPDRRHALALPVLGAGPALGVAGPGALVWVALKVGLLSYGGGFVIIPLMQADAVDRFGWMTDAEFLNAVALGQITPGPVVHTVAVVGYAAAGLWGGLLAALVAFTPSFAFVLVGAPRFEALRRNDGVQHFFGGAGPAVVGAIAGSAVPLALALDATWQWAVLAAVTGWLVVLRRGVVPALLGAGALGVLAAATGQA